MTTATGPKAKDASVQSLRGLAVVLLVATHVYGIGDDNGLRVEGDTVGRYLVQSLEYLRLPLFTVISGYVYALRPLSSPAALPGFVKGKARRLLVPLIPLTAIVVGLQMVGGAATYTPSTADFARGYLYGYSHLWFLQAIFLVMLVVGLLDARGRLRTLRGWTAAWLVGAAVYVAVLLPTDLRFFSVDGAVYLFPFFLLGCALVRFVPALHAPRVLGAALVVFAVSLGAQQVLLATDAEVAALPDRALGVVVGTSGIYLLFRARRHLTSRVLAWVGGYAFTIYLLHTIAAAGSRILLGRLGIEAVPVLFTVGLAAAILLPVAFQLTFGRIGWVRAFFLGERAERRATASVPRESDTVESADPAHAAPSGPADRREGAGGGPDASSAGPVEPGLRRQ